MARISAGMIFGLLEAICFVNRYRKAPINGKYSGSRVKWLCRCSCGNDVVCFVENLLRKHSSSCGCKRTQSLRKLLTTHGLSGTPIYISWVQMMGRCFNQRNQSYKDYGGRGITVCEQWKTSPEQFALDLGDHPGRGFSLDRIDNSGNYEPGNVRWSTAKTQCRNRRGNRLLTAFGRTQALAAWAEEYGFKPVTISNRLAKGMSLELALETPLDTRRHRR